MVQSYMHRPLPGAHVTMCKGIVKPTYSDREHYGTIFLLKIGTRDCPRREDGNPVEAYFIFRSLRPMGDRPPPPLSLLREKSVRFSLCFTVEQGIEARDVFLSED